MPDSSKKSDSGKKSIGERSVTQQSGADLETFTRRTSTTVKQVQDSIPPRRPTLQKPPPAPKPKT